MKKIISMILCLMLVLSLATTAFAAEGDPTISIPDGDTHAYDIYQIFTAKLTNKEGKIVLSDVQWGTNGTDTGAVDQDILDELAAVATSADNEAKLDVITKYVNLDSTPVASLPTAAGEKSVEVAPGYYLIKDKNAITGNDSYTTYIVEIVDDATITRKADVPKVVKKIVEGENRVDENQIAIGEKFTYEIVGTLPTNIADYTTYFYKFHDTLSAGLDYEGNLTVKVEGVDVTKYFYVKASEGENGTTRLVVAIQDLLALKNAPEFEGKTIDADTKVVVTYDAKLNENAIVGTNGNLNEVYLEFDNNPNDDGEGTTEPPTEYPPENPDEPGDEPEEPTPESGKPTGNTPKDEVWTYTTEVIINKVDGANKPLNGAKFQIKGLAQKNIIVKTQKFVESEEETATYWKLKDGTYTQTAPVEEDNPATETVNEKTADFYESTTTKYKVEIEKTTQTVTEEFTAEAFVDANGKLVFTGLPAGEYTISETVVPAGYNSIPDFKVTITWNDATDSADDCEWTYVWTGITGNGNSVTVVNQAGSTLPETGGIGTTLFYVFGTIMVLGAAVLLITKKRMSIAE